MKKHSIVSYLLLATVILGVFSAFSAYLVPHLPLIWQISGGVALLAALAGAYLDRTALVSLFSRRTTLHGLNSLVMVILFLAIVVVVNLIIVKYDVKKDFTKNKLHSLSDQSVKFVKGLDQEITLRAFISPVQRPEFERIFEKYTYYNPKRLKADYVDVDQNPMLVEKHDIKRTGTILVESAARSSKIDNLTGPDDPKLEQKITNALIQVAKGQKKRVYFVTGHGELMAGDSQPRGLSQVKEALEGSMYQVEDLVLVDKEAIPGDAELIVVAAPKSDLLEHELKALEQYILKGGKAMFLMEPDSTATLKPLLAKLGADWHRGQAVVETNVLQRLAGGNPLTPIVNTYDGTHEITQEMRQPSIFAISSPVEKGTAPQGATVVSLFSTSRNSFEVPLKGDTVKLDPSKDKRGPFSLGIAVTGKVAGTETKEERKEGEDEEEKPAKDWRVVVVGDSDFATNSLRNRGLNADLFDNMVAWLSHDADLIAIRPKPTDSSTFEITEARFRVINLASVVVAPLLMFLGGFGVWFSRRRK